MWNATTEPCKICKYTDDPCPKNQFGAKMQLAFFLWLFAVHTLSVFCITSLHCLGFILYSGCSNVASVKWFFFFVGIFVIFWSCFLDGWTNSLINKNVNKICWNEGNSINSRTLFSVLIILMGQSFFASMIWLFCIAFNSSHCVRQTYTISFWLVNLFSSAAILHCSWILNNISRIEHC